ncbi:hypothetical protein KGF54_004412 [Candida jiufengensis]|uniref:uncharacterized protein n=1 Tax=Candida jiufengensis TaxID=497108 RepID=UPI002223F3F6|nr:uncharacterized protein KGF54_004412 [Candida jiufengensis]KAI5951338.1 hypothetical protein KGF54_004412 [Candida jiufengensis]
MSTKCKIDCLDDLITNTSTNEPKTKSKKMPVIVWNSAPPPVINEVSEDINQGIPNDSVLFLYNPDENITYPDSAIAIIPRYFPGESEPRTILTTHGQLKKEIQNRPKVITWYSKIPSQSEANNLITDKIHYNFIDSNSKIQNQTSIQLNKVPILKHLKLSHQYKLPEPYPFKLPAIMNQENGFPIAVEYKGIYFITESFSQLLQQQKWVQSSELKKQIIQIGLKYYDEQIIMYKCPYCINFYQSLNEYQDHHDTMHILKVLSKEFKILQPELCEE